MFDVPLFNVDAFIAMTIGIGDGVNHNTMADQANAPSVDVFVSSNRQILAQRT